MGTILAIDPGNMESGYILAEHDGQEIRKVLDVGKVPNGEIFPVLCREYQHLAIEMVAGMEAGKQKVVDLFFVAAHELGMLKSPAKAKELLDKMEQLDAEYGVAWLGKKESDDAIHRLDSSLKKLCGPFFQPFFERNDTIKDWWDK
mgnify:CR=1 FL=1